MLKESDFTILSSKRSCCGYFEYQGGSLLEQLRTCCSALSLALPLFSSQDVGNLFKLSVLSCSLQTGDNNGTYPIESYDYELGIWHIVSAQHLRSTVSMKEPALRLSKEADLLPYIFQTVTNWKQSLYSDEDVRSRCNWRRHCPSN